MRCWKLKALAFQFRSWEKRHTNKSHKKKTGKTLQSLPSFFQFPRMTLRHCSQDPRMFVPFSSLHHSGRHCSSHETCSKHLERWDNYSHWWGRWRVAIEFEPEYLFYPKVSTGIIRGEQMLENCETSPWGQDRVMKSPLKFWYFWKIRIKGSDCRLHRFPPSACSF